MRKRFTEEQITRILKESESYPPKDIARKHGIHENTICNWRSKYGDMNVSEVAHLRQLEEENRRLKRLVAEQALDIQILKDVNSKNW